MGVVLPLCATARAQQVGAIRGTVRDADFDAPLPAASVTAVELGGGKTVATSDQGTFSFPEVPPGRYTLVFAKDGYIRQVKTDVVVQAGKLSDVDVSLAGDVAEMPEFVVQEAFQLRAGSEAALLQMRFDSPALMDSIGADLMSRAGASDAASALRLVAGASVRDGKSAVIRGLPDRYVSSQLNGIRLPSADEDKRAVELDQFPSVVIDSIRVSKTFTPDQQGDASGGAVNVALRGIPKELFFVRYKTEYGQNSQVKRRDDFLSYDGGGVSQWGRDDGRRGIQSENIGGNWSGAAGVREGGAPTDYKWSLAAGGKHVFDDGVEVGGLASLFYERDSAFYDNGIDDSWWVDTPGQGLTPKVSQGAVQQNEFKTALFDVTKAEQSVQWGGLGTLGVKTGNHSVDLVYLFTQNSADAATLAEDTRGKEYYFPGHDPNDPSTPGHAEPDAAPYLRLETLEYTERTTHTIQLRGEHTLGVEPFGLFGKPVLDWSISNSGARAYQPDKRLFGSAWIPGDPATSTPPRHLQYKAAANFTLGNLQRIWKDIEEQSEQYSANLRLPFGRRADDAGYLKIGWFSDRVNRKFDQESFSNFGDPSSYQGGYNDLWSRAFPFENHPMEESLVDVDYDGSQRIKAYHAMADVPLTSSLSVVGGVRIEDTEIGIVNDPEILATWFPPGSVTQTTLFPGDADVKFAQDDVLPSIGLEYHASDAITFRGSYNQTVARQTFKELTPILQQEYLGGPVFIGNPELGMSNLKNYDLRADYVPYDGGLLSVSWFKKDIEKPIEYVQRISTFDFTTPVNYPKGELSGFEFEARQDLGHFFDAMDGFSVGANATFIDSEVRLTDEEIAAFGQPNIAAPMETRKMTSAPDHLYNFYVNYDSERTGTRVSLFYTIQGDTLVAGAGESNGNFVPSLYATEFDTLNLNVSQELASFASIQFQAKNLTNPAIKTVYRSEYTGDDVIRSSATRGIDYSISIGGEIRF